MFQGLVNIRSKASHQILILVQNMLLSDETSLLVWIYQLPSGAALPSSG